MNGTLPTVLLGTVTGASVGAGSGLLLALMQSWSKDLRDMRLRRRGHPLPSDRVFARHYIPLIALAGAGVAGYLVGAAGRPLVPAALASLVLPAIRLVVLLVECVCTALFGKQ